MDLNPSHLLLVTSKRWDRSMPSLNEWILAGTTVLSAAANAAMLIYIGVRKERRTDNESAANIRGEAETEAAARRREDLAHVREIYGELTAKYETRMEEQKEHYETKLEEQRKEFELRVEDQRGYYEKKLDDVRTELEDREQKAIRREHRCRQEVHELRNQLNNEILKREQSKFTHPTDQSQRPSTGE